MATYNVDKLALALKATLDGSQETIDKQQAEQLKKIIDIDQRGHPEFLTWECRLPSGDGGERDYELLRLPWASFLESEKLDIAKLSIELNCRIKENSQHPETGRTQLTAIPAKRGSSGKEGVHRIKWSASNQQQEASVSIDGAPIEYFLTEQLFPKQQRKKKTKKRCRYQSVMIVLAILCLLAVAVYTFFQP